MGKSTCLYPNNPHPSSNFLTVNRLKLDELLIYQLIDNVMKFRPSITLLAVGIALTASTSWAQTTPTGTATSTTYPQGAIATDSTSMAQPTRQQKRAMRQSKRMMNQNASKAGTTNTSPQDARYRQSSASDGTSINNSNTTNYNSNNVTNAPTGAGSNPNTTGAMSTTTTNSTPANSSSTPPKP